MLGAFKATPIRQLETEAFVPPLDLWLNSRIATFKARLERSGLAEAIRSACKEIQDRIKRRPTRQRRRGQAREQEAASATPGEARKNWSEEWIGQQLQQWDMREKELVFRDWVAR